MKKRIAIGERDGGLSENRLFLAENLPPSLHDLEEKLIICYRRIMLVNKARCERITIDIDLNCSVPDRATRYGQMAIIEIKTAGKPDSSVIASVLSDLGIKKLSFSKYCLGISELGRGVKTNLMKIKKREIMKSLNRQNRLLLRG